MKFRFNNRLAQAALLGLFAFFGSAVAAQAMTAQEVLKDIMSRQMGESFRMGVQITDLSSDKKSKQFYAMFMGRQDSTGQSFFVEFEEPRHAAGTRFLLIRAEDKPDKCFMYLPATGEVAPLSPDMSNFNIGGTGLTAEDLPGFLPKEIESAKIVRTEKKDGSEYLVISIPASGTKPGRILWVLKNGAGVTKIQHLDAQGKVRRESNTLSFFKTSGGHELPREIEIIDSQTGKRIRVLTEHSFLNVQLPDELMDAEKFGTYKWKQ